MNRRTFRAALATLDQSRIFKLISEIPHRKGQSLLFSSLCHSDRKIKWGAVLGMGFLSAQFLQSNQDDRVRNILRKCIWNLNEECGGIGWGMPEAMAQIISQKQWISDEFTAILVSFIRPDGNYLEFEPLQEATLWGLERVSSVFPEKVLELDTMHYIRPFLDSPSPGVRGQTIRLIQRLKLEDRFHEQLKALSTDSSHIYVFDGAELRYQSIASLIKTTLIHS